MLALPTTIRSRVALRATHLCLLGALPNGWEALEGTAVAVPESGSYDSIVASRDELIQIAERQLAEAEEAFRRDPSGANQRRIEKAWGAGRDARGEGGPAPEALPWLGNTRPRPTLE